MPTEPQRYSIGELSELTGVSRRTVHFYVQRRLIDAPLGKGRGRHYDQRHVDQIRRVRDLQRHGVPLGEMAGGGLARLAYRQPDSPSWRLAQSSEAELARLGAPELAPVLRVRIDDNVTVEVAQAVSLTPELIADLASAVSAIMSKHRGAGAEPAPAASLGPGTHQSEPSEPEVEEER